MSTKTCKGCGWEFPVTHKAKQCRFCGTPIHEHICVECDELKKVHYITGVCYDCAKQLKDEKRAANLWRRFERVKKTDYTSYHKSIAKYIKSLNDKYTRWLEKIDKIPKPYKFLTEEQWLETCSFFNGCALCDNEEVTTRGYFIPFKEGGRYCNWNVIPLCEQCATRMNKQPNPFKRTCTRMNKTVNTDRGMSKKKVETIAIYLSKKMEALIGE